MRERNKHPDKQLSETEIKYIRKRYATMSVADMGRNLHVPVHKVRQYLNDNKLDPYTPPQWNKKNMESLQKVFNVDLFRGEYSWLV